MVAYNKLYLLAYNATEMIGWSFILYILISHYGDNTSTFSLWDKIWLPLTTIQLSAYLEVIHSMIGIVRSNLFITISQVSSRACLLLVLFSTPWEFVGSSFSLPYTLLFWSISEIIRYSYYLLNLLSYVPYFLTWLRYSTFVVFYPCGISGELWCIYNAFVHSKSHPEVWSYSLPNSWNFTFSYLYFLIFFSVLYIPGFPILYIHMISQRKKVLCPKIPGKKVK